MPTSLISRSKSIHLAALVQTIFQPIFAIACMDLFQITIQFTVRPEAAASAFVKATATQNPAVRTVRAPAVGNGTRISGEIRPGQPRLIL